MARNEWQVDANGIKFFCWKDEFGLTTMTGSDESKEKLEGCAKLLRHDGYVVTIADESNGLFTLVGKKVAIRMDDPKLLNLRRASKKRKQKAQTKR